MVNLALAIHYDGTHPIYVWYFKPYLKRFTTCHSGYYKNINTLFKVDVYCLYLYLYQKQNKKYGQGKFVKIFV